MKVATRSRVIVASLAACSLLLYGVVALPQLQRTQVADDAYMFLRYAKHWLSGKGFSWNPEEGPVYGITSVSYLLVVTAARGLTNLPDSLLLAAISFVAALASVAVLTTMGFVFFEYLRADWLPLLVIPTMVAIPLFWRHSVSGMETTLAVFFNSVFCVFLLYFAKHRSKASFIYCLLAAYASFLTRPDAGFYCVLLPPLVIITDDARHWKQALLYVITFAVLACGDLALKNMVFGSWIPLPFFAKSSGFYRGYIAKWNAGYETLLFLRGSLPYIVLMAFFVSRRTFPRLAAFLLPVLLTFGYFAVVTQIMGHGARYYYPTLPFMITGAYVVSDDYMHKRSAAPPRDRFLLLRAVILLVLLVVLVSPRAEDVVMRTWEKWAIGESTPFVAKTLYTTRATETLPSLGWGKSIREMDALLQKLPPNVIIAASEYGYIGSRHPTVTIIDLVGLHDRYIARHGFSASYLFSRMPDIIWFPHPDYTYTVKDILDSTVFMKEYEFYPNAYDYGLAVRRSSTLSTDILRVLEEEFSRIYPGRVLSDYLAEPLDALGEK